MERVISSLRGLTTAPNKTYAAGETWSERSQGALLGNGQPLLRRISVDYVLFADESEWGPDVKKGSLKLKGISEGWRAAHAHLARVLQEKGAQAVVTELSRSR
jgi:hypothetical protein